MDKNAMGAADTIQEGNSAALHRAWIKDSDKLVSFHWIENAEAYESEESVFWERIHDLVHQGYRIQ